MVQAEFLRSDDSLMGFCVSGHAGYADFGQDIVCASVTSAVQLTANGITEILGVPAEVLVSEEGKISLSIPGNRKEEAQAFLKALYLHLTLLSQDYEGTIKITDSEV